MKVDGFSDLVRVGSGGLGDVYRATRDSTGSVVAIKELHARGSLDDRERRVRRELRALVGLRGHPHVVNLEEVVRDGAELLLVMEYLPGGSLEERSAALGGTLPLNEVVLVGQHAAAALATAHAAGIVHRDIKPQNLLVGAFGAVKVCDFGIAAVSGHDAGTATSAVSFRFASPEELRSEAAITSAVDVYSLGVTLAKLLTNRYFTHETAHHLDDAATTPGGARQADVAGLGESPGAGEVSAAELALRSLLRRCLAQIASRRPTADELVSQFAAIASSLGADALAQLAPVAVPGRADAGALTASTAPGTSVRRRSVRVAWAVAAGIWVGVAVLAVVLLR